MADPGVLASPPTSEGATHARSAVAWGAGSLLVQLVVPLLGAPLGVVGGAIVLWRARGALRGLATDDHARPLVRIGRALGLLGLVIGAAQVFAFFVGLALFGWQVIAFLFSILHGISWLSSWIPAIPPYTPPIL